MTLHIRAATPDDAAAIAPFHVAIWRSDNLFYVWDDIAALSATRQKPGS